MHHFYNRHEHVCIHKAAKPKPVRVKTHTYNKLSRFSDRMGGLVRLDLFRGMKAFKSKISAEELARAWESQNPARLMAAIPWDKLPSDIDPALKKFDKTIKDSAMFTLEKLPPNINKKLRMDSSNPTIRNFLSKRTGSLIVDIQSDTQRAIQKAVIRRFTEAMTPRDVANEIKNSIGLDPRRQQALYNFNSGLKEDGGYTPEYIDRVTEDYSSRLLDDRSMTIARTETRLAVNEGQLSVWKEGMNQGLISKEAEKEWVVDGAPCEICEPMDGVRVGLNDAWVLDYPNGGRKLVYNPTEAHPNCFCGMELHFGDETEGGTSENEETE